MTSSAIPTRLRLAVGKSGISIRGLSTATKTSTGAVWSWLKGKYLPAVNTIEKLAAVLGVSPSWLAFGSVTIEVCQRLMDQQSNGNPRYHAQIEGRPRFWAAGSSIDDAIGNLVRTHPTEFAINITILADIRAR